MQEPLFSVVMPVYKVAPYIQTTLESLYRQTEPDFEIVVIDDGSPDETAEILSRQSDPRLRVIRQENAGASAARNRGIREARGRWVAFLDGDDAWVPNHLELARAALEAHPEYLWYGALYRRVRAERLCEDDYREAAPRGRLQAVNWYVDGSRQVLPCSSLVVRRDLMMKEPEFFPLGVKMFEDNIAFSRLGRRHPMMLLRQSVTMLYLERASSASAQYGRFLHAVDGSPGLDALRLQQQLAAEPDCSPEARMLYREMALCNWYSRITAASLICWLPEIRERRPMTGGFWSAWLSLFCRIQHVTCRAMRWGICRRLNALRRAMSRRAAACRVELGD